MKPLMLTVMLALMPGLTQADDVTETLESVISAYKAGDVQYALEELAYAKQLLQAMKAEGLVAFLPPAPAGWVREVSTQMNTEMTQGLAMLGGGTGAEATYSANGLSVTLSLMADNPMVGAMGAMLSNPMLMGTAGPIVRIGRQKFVNQDGELTGLVDNRILIQASGAQVEQMLPILEGIDYRALADFGR